jgi:large subunit ribosomal protein L10
MPTQRKIYTVQNLTQKLKDAKSLVLADYRGLSVEQINQLRRQAKAVGGELQVVKNRLLKIAAGQAKVNLEDQALTGPTVALWAWENELSPLKVLAQFQQEFGLPLPKIGIFAGETVSGEEIGRLAKIPSQDQLQVKLVGALSSPTFRLVNALEWSLRKLVYVLRAKADLEK